MNFGESVIKKYGAAQGYPDKNIDYPVLKSTLSVELLVPLIYFSLLRSRNKKKTRCDVMQHYYL